MNDRDYRKHGMNPFAAMTAVATMGLSGLMAVSVDTDSDGTRWLLMALPVVLAAAAYALVNGFKGERTVPTTTRTYPIHAPCYSEVTVGALTQGLQSRGYRVAVVATRDGVPVPAGTGLRGAELRVRDERLAPAVGELRLLVNVQGSGAVFGVVEAVDAGAGFYDEMAQFALVELAASWPELAVASPQTERQLAVELAATLPESPYGLALL